MAKRCESVISDKEIQYQCNLKCEDNEKYCALHQSKYTIIDYIEDKEIIDNNDKKIKIINQLSTFLNYSQNDNNTIIKNNKLNFDNLNEKYLETKLLILQNEDQEKIANLIGPVFYDITLSCDDNDPITCDEICKIENGNRVAGNISKYLLFSYYDLQLNLRCLTIFSICTMIKENNLLNMNNNEIIQEKDINRAKILIEYYKNKIGIFEEEKFTDEKLLENRLFKIFSYFHNQNVYIEVSWFMDLTDGQKLSTIISEIKYIIINNLIFTVDIPNNMDKLSVYEKKELFASIMEQIIKIYTDQNRQFPAWIILSALSYGISEIKDKYPIY